MNPLFTGKTLDISRRCLIRIAKSLLRQFGRGAFFLAAVASSSLAASQVVGPFNGHYYQLVGDGTGVDWYQARDAASNMTANGLPGYLATITTVEEHTFVATSIAPAGTTWLGASDEQYEGWFKWVTGESAGYGIGIAGMYASWSAGQPDGGSEEDCLASFGDFSNWADEGCDEKIYYFLVEYSAPILATKYCHGRGGHGMDQDPNAHSIVPELRLIANPGCEDSPQAILFDDRSVLLTSIPVYLNSTAETDPKFDDFISSVPDDTFCLEMTQTVLDDSGNVVSYGSGCGGPVVGVREDDIGRVEMLVGDEFATNYDSQTSMFTIQHDYTVNLYGHSPSELQISIDIKPGSSRNPVNLKAKGNIPVAILSSDTFDATQVNWETVRFGPSGATERHQRVHVRDADYDGDMDVVLHFKTRDTGILCGDSEATLTGATFSGEEFTGSDVIKIVKCPKNKKNKKKNRR
jgi:hypothetical protein